MAHAVEMMFSVREKPWHYAETKEVTKLIQEAPTSKEALELAGLNWQIEGRPVFDADGNEIHGFKANTRDKDGRVMGIVTNQYQVVQNADAFEFTDALIGGDVRYETAGSLRGGRQIWLLARMPDTKIAGDAFEPFICFTNTHDGSGAVRACMTPVRVVCNNTLNLALSGAKRSWSTPHRGNVQMRLEEARLTLELAEAYLEELGKEADRLAGEKFTEADADKVIDTILAVPEDATQRMRQNAENVKTQIVACMFSPDLMKYLNTKWGFINAVSDYVGHGQPARRTQSFEENRWGNIINGRTILDQAVSLVK